MKLIVMCRKIPNHPSVKFGYFGITRPPLRVLFILKIGKLKALFFKNPASVNVQCVRSDCVIEHSR